MGPMGLGPRTGWVEMRCCLVLVLGLHCSDAFLGIGKVVPVLRSQGSGKSLSGRQPVSSGLALHPSLPNERTNSVKAVKMVIASELVVPAMALGCLSPTLLGLWKSEYTVSYGEVWSDCSVECT
jgi:hypothetical protein